MNKIVLYIYDKFRRAPFMAWGIFIVLTVAFVLSILTLSYKEDISDFLPLDEDNQTALSVYQDISGANKVFAIISTKDSANVSPQELVDGVEIFVSNIEELDSAKYITNIIKDIDMEQMLSLADVIYQNAPYFLSDKDYERIDSLLSIPEYIDAKVADDKQMLLFPSSNLLTENISRDPLNLFTPIMGRLSGSGASIQYDTYDGYILSPDAKKAIVILESAFGAHESENNAKLVEMLNAVTQLAESANDNLDIHVIGGPVIAVSNANRIKSDSILAVCIAGILILALLIYVFRRIRNILLIVVSVGWGWLLAMGVIALFYSSVSIIVIGIASVILGIAVNYPLHLIDHLKDSPDPRASLKEIVSPLVVGNITTVGAFLCLVPLNSPALHDLGLFSSLLLVGTILFVLTFLPHAIRTPKSSDKDKFEPILISKLAGISIENSRWTVYVILLLTIVFSYFSLQTEFDSDMRNINYMTPEQQADMAYFQKLQTISPNTESVYIVSNGKTWDEALTQNEIVSTKIDSIVSTKSATTHNHVSSFLISKAEQAHRLELWNNFLSKYKGKLTSDLQSASENNGFSSYAFSQFYDIIDKEYTVQDFDYFEDLVANIFVGNISHDESTGRKSIVQILDVATDKVDDVKNAISNYDRFEGLCFDVKSMNGAIANTLSNDFNYIGFACGFIVFIFLWISLGSIELAIVSFLPMAISWIWILGLMAILNIKFNIVNVILATFIFGQGDDYTIFMTEGLSYEFAYRKKLLASYKGSIIVSALIMFIGIGTLMFAKHPALRSLGEVTVVGMLSVVMMAYLFPPLIFNWLIRSNGKLRFRPITLKKIAYTTYCAVIFFIQLLSGYILGFVMFVLTKPTDRKRTIFHKYCCSTFRFDIKRMPGIKFRYNNSTNEDFSKPAIIICNHQSLLDSFCMMFITPKIVLLANEHIKTNPIVGTIFKWCNFITVKEGAENIAEIIKPLINKGYSLAIFPEGARPDILQTKVQRFHKGAFHLANALNLDILPVYFYGLRQIMPKGSALINNGTMYIEIGERISLAQLRSFGDEASQAKSMRKKYIDRLDAIHSQIATVEEVSPTVIDRYIYKGRDIEVCAKKTLKNILKCSTQLQNIDNNLPFLIIDQDGQGELALLLSLMYPNSEIYCHLTTSTSNEIMSGCIQDFTTNIHLIDDSEIDSLANQDMNIYVVKQATSDTFKLNAKQLNIIPV